jgi:hypothetical protein
MKLSFAILTLLILLPACKSSPVDTVSGGTATFRYSVTERAHVTLRIENSYNTTVAILVNEVRNPGLYQVSTSFADYPKGVYFYILSIVPESGGTPITQVQPLVLG